jgi:hypothetical protein
MKVMIDGQWRRITSLKITTATDDSAPPVTQPKTPTTPKKPVKPKNPVKPSGNVTEFGPLSKNKPLLRREMKAGEVYSYGFMLPKNGTVPMAIFGMTPQSETLTDFDVWLSETPNGKPLNSRYAVLKRSARRGDQLQVIAAVRGRGAERRGCPVDAGKTYYFNMQANRDHSMRWRISGAF